jgi:hypothetical protein
MSKNTFQVNGGAMPKFDRGAIMVRAWAIFREPATDTPTGPASSSKNSTIGWADMSRPSPTSPRKQSRKQAMKSNGAGICLSAIWPT